MVKLLSEKTFHANCTLLTDNFGLGNENLENSRLEKLSNVEYFNIQLSPPDLKYGIKKSEKPMQNSSVQKFESWRKSFKKYKITKKTPE